VENLLKLHDFRLVTDNSQPYEHMRAFKTGKEWAECQQRPYVSFIMPREHGRSFFKMLKKRPELVVQASELHPYRVLPDSHEEVVVVTRERTARTAEDLQSTEWKPYTRLCNSDMSERGYYCLDVIKRSSPLRFSVAASEWNDPLDLLGVVLEVATKCGVPRMS
jgi:hypothetical protein